MAISFDIANATYSDGTHVTSGGCDFPSSTTDDTVLLLLSYINVSGNTTSITATPSGATARASNTSTGAGIAIYSFAGGTTGTTSFAFSTNPASFRAAMITVSGLKASSPFSSQSQASTSGTTHTMNSTGTAPYADAVFFGAIAMSAPAGTSNGYFYSADEIYNGQGNYFSDVDGLGTNQIIAALNIAYKVATASGASSSLAWASYNTAFNTAASLSAAATGFWLSPSQAPTVPSLITPIANEKITVGRTYSITWNTSTDPNIAAASLQYQIQYSNDGGLSWTNVVSLTSAGVATYSWNTSGLAPGTYKLKIRAYNGTEYSAYSQGSFFYLLADAPPLPPTNLSPSSGVIDRTASQVFTWTFNDEGDTQKSYYIEYSANADMSSSSNTGEQTSGTSSHTFSGGTFTAGQVYWRVKTKGIVDSTYSSFSAIASVLAASPPSAPNITAPTAGSPPSVGTPTITWTSTGQEQYRIQIKQGTPYVYQGGWVIGTQKSVTSPYTFANGVSYTLYLAIKDVNGLASTEDSETFTPSYTGPATPTITVTGINATGAVQISIANSDTPAYTYIYRYVTSAGASSAIRISPSLGADATYIDNNCKSGVSYTYFARSFVSSGGYSDSSTAAVTLSLSYLHLHTISRTSTTSNAAISAVLLNPGKINKAIINPQRQVQFTGRSSDETLFSQSSYEQVTYNVLINQSEILTEGLIDSIIAAQTSVCVRDQAGNRIIGKLSKIPYADTHFGIEFQLVATQEDYSEAIV
jgi:hypothetical protein